MNIYLITHIQEKIKSLKSEIQGIELAQALTKVESENDKDRINECIHKIQVLHEIIVSFGVQEPKKLKAK